MSGESARSGFTRDVQIVQSQDAQHILKSAEALGLHDIREWVTQEWLQSFLDLDAWIAYLAVVPDQPEHTLGLAVMGVEEEGRLWIEMLVVDTNARRQGIASALCEAMIQYGIDHDKRALFVDVDHDNVEGYQFYTKLGFRTGGRISLYYYDSTPAIIMLREIP